MTTTTNTPQFTTPKTVSKIVTFYTDGTFSEYVPAPMPQSYPYPNPLTVPYPAPNPYPWWQSPVSYGAGTGQFTASVTSSSENPGGYGR